MIRVVTFGEIMGRMEAPGFKRFAQAMPGSLNVTFAGAEASIAQSIAYLGGEASFVTALPANAIADACVSSLKAFGVNTQHILRTQEGRLGLYFLEKGANQRPTQVLYDRDGSAISQVQLGAFKWNTILAQADWFVLSGITPALSRSAADVCKEALAVAFEMGVSVAIDLNYRSKLWRWDPLLGPRDLATKTMRDLLPFADLLIGGKEDAEALLGIAEDTPLEAASQTWKKTFPRLRHVATTLREHVSASHNNLGGMLHVCESNTFFYAPALKELYLIPQIVDRIGTGDAFTAALIFALSTPSLSEPQKAISFATAAGCLAHSIEGDQNLSTREEIESLQNGETSGRVRR